MPPAGGGGGCTEQDHPPTTGRDEEAPSHPTPPPPAVAPVTSEKKKKQEPPAASLPEGPLVEILSRLPYTSLCRFKCVSRPWLALCSDPEIRKRCPQTLSGFFFNDHGRFRFGNLSGRGPPFVDPSLPFLGSLFPNGFTVEQCCSGLLLCKSPGTFDSPDDCYVVCNPATAKWTALPPMVLADRVDLLDLNQADQFLGFDAAVPSRFAVFAPLTDHLERITEVAIYSSETRRWTSMQSEAGSETTLADNAGPVFLNGTMHFTTLNHSILTVDMEGNVWREIEVPYECDMPHGCNSGSMGRSQGRLHAWHVDRSWNFSIWVLEDYGAGKWTLKHIVNILELFGRPRRKGDEFYWMFAIHPDCNLIFLAYGETTVSLRHG